MTKNAKRVIICLAVAIVLTVLILLIPGFFLKSIPTVSPVKVAKVNYTESVTADGNIYRDEETGAVSVQTFINEKDISHIKTGLKTEITGAAFPDKTYQATVIAIAGTAQKIVVANATKTVVEVWAQIDNPDDTLKSGYTASVKILTGSPEKKRLLPYDVVNQDEVGEYIYVLKGNTAVKRYIKTGDELPEGLEVISGLDENEEVIRVSDGVSDGAEVAVSENGGESND
jgi:multidrug efflux pump subunit AcrA (membrane-fusion protein)